MNAKKIQKHDRRGFGFQTVLKIRALIAKKSSNLLMGKHFPCPAFYSAGCSKPLFPAG